MLQCIISFLTVLSLLLCATASGTSNGLVSAVHRRQVPVVVAPPSGPRASSIYTPLISQPTSTLNYWWPYGSDGVNPTVTPTPTSTLPPTSGSSTSDSDDNSTSLDEELSGTPTTDRTTTSTSVSASSSSESSSSLAASETPSSAVEASSTYTPGFNVISLLPLFIILGVISLATLIGWTYGRCLRCLHRKKPAPGGPNIGGRPYEFGGFDSDAIAPMRSTGMGWVDASRIYDRTASPPVVYHAVRNGGETKEPGTPSKNKAYNERWFRHTFSRNKRPDVDSPSGEKGLNHFPGGGQTRGTLPASTQARNAFPVTSSFSTIGSPKSLRVVNDLTSTAGAAICSPTTSAQPTPRIPGSRYGSLRRKTVEKVQAEDEENLLAASKIPGAFRGFDDVDMLDNWTDFRAEPLKRSPARRYTSDDSAGSPRRLTRSPDPQQHRVRMRRLRAAQNMRAFDSASPRQILETSHPLSPSSFAVLSPPLQPHLFFVGNEKDAVSPKGPDASSRSQDHRSKGRTVRPELDDPFGPVISPSARLMQPAKGKGKLPESGSVSTQTVPLRPLSPEIRGAAMTRFEEIVKTSWSMRNLPQSPTMYGALSPLLSSHAFYDNGGHKPGDMAPAGSE